MTTRRPNGFTLIEVLMVLLIAGVMTSIAAGQYRTYLDRIGPERAANMVGTYIAMTRSFAIQSRAPVTLFVDPTARKLWIRTLADTLRSVELGADTDFLISTLEMGFPGDSMTFSARGVCRECGVTGTGSITVAGEKVEYLITFNALGVWKKEKQ